MMANKGVFEEVLDKMPYVMVGVFGTMCIMTLVYGIYSYVEKRDKRKLLISIICSINIIFVGFLISEHLSNRQMLLVLIGIVLFNVLSHIKLVKNKPVKIEYRNTYNPRIKRVDYADKNKPILEFLSKEDFEYSFEIGQIISIRMKDKTVTGELLHIETASLTVKDNIGTEITIAYGDIWEIEDIMCGSTELFYFNPDSCYIDNWADAICRMTNDIVGIDHETFERYADEFYIKFLIAFTFEYERKLKDDIDYNSLKKMAERFDTDFLFQAKDYLEKNAPDSLAMKYYKKFMVIRVDKDYILRIINRCRIRIVENSRLNNYKI